MCKISFENLNLSFSGSHKKFSLVLFQITCYICLRLKPLKSVKKEFNMLQIIRVQAFLSSENKKLLHFLMDSGLRIG